MYKKLCSYTAFIEEAAKKPSPELAEYHTTMLAYFQHERLVHLIVTLAFALFMVLFFVLFCVLSIFVPQGSVLIACVGGATAILLVTTICYVIHYYHLENGVQKLEAITPRVFGF